MSDQKQPSAQQLDVTRLGTLTAGTEVDPNNMDGIDINNGEFGISLRVRALQTSTMI